jgi:putative DNA primase/helicase
VLTEIAKLLPAKADIPWEPVLTPLSAYTIERKEYLWYPFLTRGEPNSIEGDPATGKSALMVKVICHLTTGTPFPTLFAERPEHAFAPRNVVLFSAEDDPSSTILPRVLINGGDPTRVHTAKWKRHPETRELVPMTLQDLDVIAKVLRQSTPVLMAFDPLQSFFGPGVDMNHATDTRRVLDAVRDLCKSHDCTQLYLRHNGKSQRSKAMHAALGSIDITAHMRSVLTTYKDPDIVARRILAHTKSNGRYGPSLQFMLTGVPHDALRDTEDGEELLTVEDVRVDWDGMSPLTGDDLNAREYAHGGDTQEANSALDEAREFLREILQDGPLLVDEIKAQAKHAGITERTLRRAKDKDNVKARRQARDGIPPAKWPWRWHARGE